MQCGEGSRETGHKHCGEKASEKKEFGLHSYPPFPSLLPASGVHWSSLCSHRCCTKETLNLGLAVPVFHGLLRLHLKAVVPAPSVLIGRLFKTWTALMVRNVSNFQIIFIFVLTLPAHLICSSSCLLTSEIFIEAVVLQISHGIARLTKASPFSLCHALSSPWTCSRLTISSLYQGAARAGEPGVKGEGRAGKAVDLLARSHVLNWGEQGTSISSHQSQTQPSDCRHIHSNEAGLRSSQGISLCVRVNSVTQAGTKCKCQSLDAAPELMGRGLDEDPHSPFHVSATSRVSQQGHIWADPALSNPSPRRRRAMTEPIGMSKESFDCLEGGKPDLQPSAQIKSFHCYLLMILYRKHLPWQNLHHFFFPFAFLAHSSLLFG